VNKKKCSDRVEKPRR